jgi:hypothetical protein
MNFPTQSAGLAEGLPLTHRQCIAAGRALQARHGNKARPWVQLRRHVPGGSYVLCGQVAELAGDREEWFKVETTDGPAWSLGRHLRLCSGDGRCTCEPAPEGEAPCCT